LGLFSAVSNHFRPQRHLFNASAYRQIRAERYAVWRDVTGLSAATVRLVPWRNLRRTISPGALTQRCARP
jgi:hypothetical protein